MRPPLPWSDSDPGPAKTKPSAGEAGLSAPHQPLTRGETVPETRSNLSRLCSRCRTIAIETFLHSSIQIPQDGLQTHVLGKRGKSSQFRAFCPLCQLFLSVATTYRWNCLLELRLFDRLRNGDDEESSANPDDTLVQVSETLEHRFLAVVRSNKTMSYDHPNVITFELGTRGLLVPMSTQLSNTAGIHEIDPNTVDFSLCRDWMERCTRNHESTCIGSPSKSNGEGLHVIDCQTGKIVPLQDSDSYVALSYVWGRNATRDESFNTEEFSQLDLENLPRTIKDATSVATSIGQRYLWVDQYCIGQRNDVEKQAAISRMNHIYADAEVTIVALYGKNFDAGLPGVSSVARVGFQKVSLQSEGHLVSTFPPLANVINDSTWATRGWTYQEARAARRCLFFTEFQAYFCCHAMITSESLPSEPDKNSPISMHLNPKGLNAQMFSNSHNNKIARGLFLDRLNYSQRYLTYSQDSFNAFKGILRLHPYMTYWAIPISHLNWPVDLPITFAMGLLWVRRPENTTYKHVPKNNKVEGKIIKEPNYRRITGFPTWSWTSVTGDIYQDHYEGTSLYANFIHNKAYKEDPKLKDDDCTQVQKSMPRFRLSPSGEPSLADATESARKAGTTIIPEISQSLFVTGELVRVMPVEDDPPRYYFPENPNFEAMDPKETILAHFDLDQDRNANRVERLRKIRRIDPSLSVSNSIEAQDALIVIGYRDSDQAKSQTRFVLMLLRWIEHEKVAERAGLMGSYQINWKSSFVSSIPRRKCEFELR